MLLYFCAKGQVKVKFQLQSRHDNVGVLNSYMYINKSSLIIVNLYAFFFFFFTNFE